MTACFSTDFRPSEAGFAAQVEQVESFRYQLRGLMADVTVSILRAGLTR